MLTRDVSLTLRAQLSEPLAGQQTVSISVGPRRELVQLLVAEDDASDVLGYDEQPGWARFPHSRTPRPVHATVLVDDGRSTRRVDLHDDTPAHPHVQLLPGDEILVVGARCRRFQDGTTERNACVFGADGALRHAATFGDGINDVQTTSRGEIWVAYFDEGVFGNYGWSTGEGAAPIGASGLVRFDDRGARVWEYSPPEGIDTIADCYALNVSDEATWAYYYTEFPLVRIDAAGTVEAWRTEVSGARAFATDGHRVLFYGGYGEERGRCLLGRFAGEAIVGIVPCRLILPSGEPLGEERAVGRGPQLHVFAGTEWYSVDVRALS